MPVLVGHLSSFLLHTYFLDLHIFLDLRFDVYT